MTEIQPLDVRARTMTTPGRRRAAVAIAAAAMLAVILTGCLSDGQNQEVTLINQQRSAEKKSTLTANNAAMTKAQAWSEHMARTGVLEHTGGGTSVDPTGVTGWCQYGENVGYGPTIDAVHKAFLASPPHHANMVGPYNVVGTGTFTAKGVTWVTEIYLKTRC